MEEVTVCNGLVRVGIGAFPKTKIKEIAFPDTVIEIGAECFWLCKKLQSIKFPMEMRIHKDEFNAVNAMAEKHKDLSLSGEKYLIRPFKEWYDFLKEGSELHRAVHYYAINQYRRGEDYLFAMRKTDEPDAPFITLEFDPDGNLKQARKLNNALAKEEDELAFVNEFRKKVLMPYIIEQKKSTTYLHLLEIFLRTSVHM